MNELISVVVPVYNASKYVAKCIQSIQKQSYDNWELILVDDGSTDNSGAICDMFAEKDSRIRVIHQENQGALKSRLNGVARCSGEYIALADADDLLANSMLARLASIQKDYDADIVCCGYRTLSHHGMLKGSAKKAEHCEIRQETGREISKLVAAGAFSATVWGKLYRKKLFDDVMPELLQMPKIFNGEDCIINAAVFNAAKAVIVTDETLYCYRVGGYSAKSSYKTMEDLQKFYAWRKKFLIENQADRKYLHLNLTQVLNMAVFYAHYGSVQSRDRICEILSNAISDIDEYAPDYLRKSAFDLQYAMSDEEFHDLYKEELQIRLKQFILRLF